MVAAHARHSRQTKHLFNKRPSSCQEKSLWREQRVSNVQALNHFFGISAGIYARISSARDEPQAHAKTWAGSFSADIAAWLYPQA